MARKVEIHKNNDRISYRRNIMAKKKKPIGTDFDGISFEVVSEARDSSRVTKDNPDGIIPIGAHFDFPGTIKRKEDLFVGEDACQCPHCHPEGNFKRVPQPGCEAHVVLTIQEMAHIVCTLCNILEAHDVKEVVYEDDEDEEDFEEDDEDCE